MASPRSGLSRACRKATRYRVVIPRRAPAAWNLVATCCSWTTDHGHGHGAAERLRLRRRIFDATDLEVPISC
jgi:hypothetical protein